MESFPGADQYHLIMVINRGAHRKVGRRGYFGGGGIYIGCFPELKAYPPIEGGAPLKKGNIANVRFNLPS